MLAVDRLSLGERFDDVQRSQGLVVRERQPNRGAEQLVAPAASAHLEASLSEDGQVPAQRALVLSYAELFLKHGKKSFFRRRPLRDGP